MNNLVVAIVTLEVSNPDSKRIIKLPDACIEFGIRFIDINLFLEK